MSPSPRVAPCNAGDRRGSLLERLPPESNADGTGVVRLTNNVSLDGADYRSALTAAAAHGWAAMAVSVS